MTSACDSVRVIVHLMYQVNHLSHNAKFARDDKTGKTEEVDGYVEKGPEVGKTKAAGREKITRNITEVVL